MLTGDTGAGSVHPGHAPAPISPLREVRQQPGTAQPVDRPGQMQHGSENTPFLGHTFNLYKFALYLKFGLWSAQIT